MASSIIIMAGFSISLKNKVAKKPGPRKSAFSDHVSKNTTTQIDGFSKRGAMLGHKAVDHTDPLVITPVAASSRLPKRASEQKHPERRAAPPDAEPQSALADAEHQALQSLLSEADTGTLVIRRGVGAGGEVPEAEVPDADYEAVPVDQFGAALLRGMGWDGRFEKPEPRVASRRKLGAVLGIGAKPLDADLEPELTKKNISAPLQRRHFPGESTSDPDSTGGGLEHAAGESAGSDH